ncbi:ABC transporter ATP-binding protein [Thermaerobacter sp. PB12/4term]|uniref:ABC transporter ATP-binding protein n=1 Tax=Thermaerobacter sp. PB12/4term TaxID=2293838 RepID=UPI000E32A055|nr:ABC transporter ATP-binding protein [Thermaerobacter sp. PB12/4term]
MPEATQSPFAAAAGTGSPFPGRSLAHSGPPSPSPVPPRTGSRPAGAASRAGTEPAAPDRRGSAEPLLEVRDLRTEFHAGGVRFAAVDGVSFTIHRGETVGLVGESGSGKSVTSLSILRLIPSPPGRITGGSILFEGRDLLRLGEAEMRRIRGNRIAMIFQEPMTSLNPVFTAGEQIAEALRWHRRLSRREAQARAVELLRLVGIPDPEVRARQYPHQMSGGMRQRVMIAMAVACDPQLLIADEPTTALDVTVQAQILDLMKDLRRRLGTAILLITHDLGVVADMADRVLVMYAGRIVEAAPVDDLFARPLHPYTEGLLASMPQLHRRAQRLHVIPGQVPSPARLPAGCRFHPRCPYAMDICRHQEPALKPAGEGRWVACWLRDEPAAGGAPAAGAAGAGGAPGAGDLPAGGSRAGSVPAASGAPAGVDGPAGVDRPSGGTQQRPGAATGGIRP